MIKFLKIDKGRDVWFTSDLHAFHKNITRGGTTWKDRGYARDFDNEYQMTDMLVEVINKTVKQDDVLFHLGDWSFGGEDNIMKFYDRLICKNIVFIRGNHDHHLGKYFPIQDIDFINISGQDIVLSHYPQLHWHQQNKGSIMLHGHLHGDEDKLIKQIHKDYKTMDVGIDAYFKEYGEYGLYHVDDILTKMNYKKELDRHESS